MKDFTKVIERMKKACAEVEGMDAVVTIEQGIDALARNITFVGGKKAVNLFKKYAIYSPEHVRENLSIFYNLIADQVAEMEQKEAIKKKKASGLSEEEAVAYLEREKQLEALGENRIFGYARVSTKDQNLERQLIALNEAGCQVIFQEKQSGKDTNRPEFNTLMNTLKAGDTLIISELTRLARSTTDLISIMTQLDEKGVSVKSLKESWLDTTTAHGRLMLTFMSGMAQFEREIMLERQAEGIKVALNNGIKFGRQLDEKADIDLAINLVKEGKYTMTQVAKMCNISRTTLWRRCKALGITE